MWFENEARERLLRLNMSRFLGLRREYRGWGLFAV